MVLVSYNKVHEFIYKKEAEMQQRESDFLWRYGLEWEACDQEHEWETYYSR